LTPEVLERVVEFRSTRPDTEMGIDGGAKDSNIARVVRFGVDVIYVGGVPYY
jgi:ribulose-phosphate 3-epimerase